MKNVIFWVKSRGKGQLSAKGDSKRVYNLTWQVLRHSTYNQRWQLVGPLCKASKWPTCRSFTLLLFSHHTTRYKHRLPTGWFKNLFNMTDNDNTQKTTQSHLAKQDLATLVSWSEINRPKPKIKIESFTGWGKINRISNRKSYKNKQIEIVPWS